LKGHALRRLAITKMARGGVQLTEIMATARHSSIAASAAYMERTDKSQVTKLKALSVNMDGALTRSLRSHNIRVFLVSGTSHRM